MNPLAAAIVVALGWAMKFLVARILLALGIQIAVVVGLDSLISSVTDSIFASLNMLDGQIYNVLRTSRIPDAVSIISAAYLTKWSMSYGKFLFVTR